jgi:hypothetical protein
MAVNYGPSQDDRTKQTSTLLYTQSPLQLLWYDIKLFAGMLYAVLGIIFPLVPFGSGPLDELYPSMNNLFDLGFHGIFIVAQLVFLFSLPVLTIIPWIPSGAFVAYIIGFILINKLLFGILNGKKWVHHSNVDLSQYPSHDDEKWIFINGVSVG